jgi:hypothetical protein
MQCQLSFAVEGAEPVRSAAAPTLAFKLRVTSADPEQVINSALVQCQIRIEAARRRYSPQEQAELKDLFDEPHRWGQTVRSLLWTQVNVNTPPFEGSAVVDLNVPCTFDFNVAATKYFHGLQEGDVPLVFLFSGSVFYAGEDGGLRMGRIAWDQEATFRLPVATWKATIDHFYPQMAWLCLERSAFERLYEYKRQHCLPTWERAIEELLDRSAKADAGVSRPIESGALP